MGVGGLAPPPWAREWIRGDAGNRTVVLVEHRVQAFALSSVECICVQKQVHRRRRSGAPKDVVDAMLGPTGNLRAPVLRVGKTVLVGFNEEAYAEVIG